MALVCVCSFVCGCACVHACMRVKEISTDDKNKTWNVLFPQDFLVNTICCGNKCIIYFYQMSVVCNDYKDVTGYLLYIYNILFWQPFSTIKITKNNRAVKELFDHIIF